jgi:predicted nucleic acid binding AN1-type Zn finger protein
MNKISMRISISMLVLVLSLWACGGSDKAADQAVETIKTEAKAAGSEPTADGIEFTAKYQCPMHCPGSGSETYGSCPVCGMHYMYNPNLPDAAAINKKLFKENPQIDPDNPKPAAGHEGHGH